MTRLEYAKKGIPDVSDRTIFMCECPTDYMDIPDMKCEGKCLKDCEACWNKEMPDVK